MEQEELFERTLKLLANPKSVFVCYGWDDATHRRWVKNVAAKLRERGFDVVVDADFEGLNPAELLWMALRAKNIVLVVSERFMETCLTGKIPATRQGAELPSFAAPADGYVDGDLNIFNVAMGIYSKGHSAGKLTSAELRDMANNAGGFSLFYEGWCLDELETLLMNEQMPDRICQLYRSGAHSLCRYPIIDFSKDSSFGASMESLVAFLEHEPIEHHKSAPRPVEFRMTPTGGERGDDLLTLLPVDAYDIPICGLTYWRPSGGQRMTVRPSVNDEGQVALITNFFHNWEKIP